MKEKQRITHCGFVKGEYSGDCPEAPPLYDDAKATAKPVIRRHGNVMKPEIKSFLAGRMSHNLAGFTFRRRYQMSVSEGTQYRNIFISSDAVEKPAVSCPSNKKEPAEPEKKRTIYKIRNSIYIPIFYPCAFYILFLYYNLYKGIRIWQLRCYS
jgi:hypothetical protein